MRALVYDNSAGWETSKGFSKVTVPDPVLAGSTDDASVIIKVRFAGVCGTDRGIWHRSAFRDLMLKSLESEHKDVRILGHEFCGEVVEAGPEVIQNHGIKIGDFVSAESHVVCDECFQCKHGQRNVCINEQILGISHDGCYAEYIKVPGRIVWKTDANLIRPEVAAMQEPFGNAVHAASKVDLAGKTVAIFGLGPVGLLLLLAVRGLGAKKIIGIEPNASARTMAEKIGIDHLIQLPAAGDTPSHHHDAAVTEEIMNITEGYGTDVSFEMAGFNSSFNNAIHATRRGGDVILFGIRNGDFTLEDYNQLILKGVTLHAVIGRQLWQTWETTKRLMEYHSNGIQDKIFDIILQKGKGTILPVSEYTNEAFEQKMIQCPKLLLSPND